MDENTLILSGLPNDFASAKPRLELHFSNRRKSGGDILEIKEYPSDKRKALLVYPEHEAAKKVLERSPHKVNFKTLGVVELQVKPLKEDGAANVASEIEETGPGPFLKEGLPQDCSSKPPLLLVSADRAIDQEILRLYFEGFTEDDVEICSHGQKQWMLKLTSQTDLKNILSKQNHDLEGSLMSVVPYDEEVVKERLDPHTFILSGLRLDCKCSHLSIFIQSCSRGAEHSWEILNDGERIAVTFKQDIDVEAFLKKCSTKKLQNMDITASRLEYTDSVLVEGRMDEISEEALKLYFSSARSHGGQIKCIHWVTDAKGARVEFENYRVAHRVAEQEHNISGVSLRTSLYYSSLQQALTGERPSMPPSPNKFSIPVDASYLKYIQSDQLCKEDFEGTFKELYASISYKDDLKYPQVVLEMAVDRESLLFCHLAHTWERKCKEAIEAMLDKYIIVTLPTVEEVWERVKDKCLSRHLKAVTVYYERAKNSVALIGQHNDVKKLQGEIQLLLSKAKEELDVEKNTVEKVIPADNKEELDFVWKKLPVKLGGVEHWKDEANLTLCIKGLRDDVNAAMRIIQDTKDNLSSQTVNLSPSSAEFLRSLDLKKFERNYFSHISATVFSSGDSIQILAEKQDAKKASDKIKEILTEDVINLTPDQAKVTTEKDWKDFYCSQIHEIQSSNNMQNIKISQSSEKIALCGFRNVVMDVARKLRGYLNNKMPVTSVIPMRSLREVEYVDACMKLSEVPQIKALDATILSSRTEVSPCLKVTATSDKVNEAVAAVERLISNIGHETHKYSGAGESKVLDKHQDALKAKVKELGCKVYLSTERGCQTSSHLSCSFKMGDFFTLTVAQGNLSQQAADAVICPLDRNLSFDNDAAQQILQAGGPQIKCVRDKLLKESEVLFAGDVVVADPGNLPAEALFYAIIPNLCETNNKSQDSMCFKSAVQKSLQNANDMHFVSLLMPALVCGAFSLSTRESCTVIIQEILAFWRRYPGIPTSLRNIFVLDSDASKVEEWHSVLKEMGYQTTDSRDTAVRSPPAKEKRPPLPPRLPKPGGNQKVIIGNTFVILKQGDITKEIVDAIVNSTNSSLKLDTGVSGAILEAAGKSVVDECAKLGTQEEDGVVVTGGGNLKCKHIIHMVGQSSAAGISIAIERVLQLCQSKDIKSLSIPAVGTGQGKINAEESIKAIFTGLQNHLSLKTSTSIKFVFIVAFEPKIFASFCQYFSRWKQPSPPTKRTVSGLQLPSIQSKSTLLPANQVKISGVRIEVKKGDITTEGVRAIVNSTNKELNLKGGVSGAIFRAAGSSIEMECKKFGPQKDDGVVITSGGQLQCDFIIHMVGPLSLITATSQVENVLEQCEKNNISTVSFPAIGTGGGQLKAAEVICAMLQGFHNHLSVCSSTCLKLINIVVYEDKIFQESLQGLKQWSRLQLDKSVEDEGNDGEDADLDSPYEWNSSDEEEDDYDGSIEVIMGPIKVKALCGDITQERTDVIVNSTNTNLDLSKGVSGAILKLAGQAVLNECKALGPQPSDGVVLTKPGNLKCKHIAHMVGQTKAQAITNSMYKVLETCDRLKAQSVSFPALGTGAGNLAASQVAKAMIDAISSFLLDKPKSSVTVVHIVIFQPKMMSDFEEVMKKFKRVRPKFGGAAAKAARRTTFLRSPNSSWSQGASSFNLETATARITFPVTVAEVYGTSAASLAQAKKFLDDTVSEECTSQAVEAVHLHLLTGKEKQGIVEASQMHQVRVTVLQNKLTVSGKREDVLLVIMQIKDSLLKAREREDREREERRIWQTVRWKVGGSDTWIGLNQRINCDLELAFHRNERFCDYQHKMKTFRVDFDNMQRTDSNGQVARIKRTPLSDAETAIIAPPPTWTKMDGKDLDIIVLPNGCKEYQKISGEFVLSCQVFAQENNKKIQVVQIQRIQHQEQWRRFAVSKQALDRKYPGNNNERLLYHGTTKDICQKITKNGFNRSFCGRNATKYGCGTYFAKEAHYSCYDSYSNPDENGHKHMYRARVLTGKPCVGQANMKEPSPLDPTNLQAGLHDCAVDNLQNPFIFVIFSDSGAYPEYLITFKAV